VLLGTNVEQAMRDVNAQVLITAKFGESATRAVGSFADRRFEEAVATGDMDGQQFWGPSGTYRAALHAAIGALTGGVAGAAGASVASLTIPEIGAAIYGLGLPAPVAQALTQAVALSIGGAIGGRSGATSAYNEASNNSVMFLMRMGQVAAQYAQQGWNAIGTGGQAVMIQCAQSAACRSTFLTASALAAINASQMAANQPSLADQIPTGYGAGGVPAVEGGTTTPANVHQGGDTTTTPGTPVNNQGTPGYGNTDPQIGDTSTSTPNNGPIGGSLAMSERAQNFEESISHLPANERVAEVRTTLGQVASENGWTKNLRLTRINGRDVYSSLDGSYYAVDTQHGRFEQTNSRGIHQGELNIDLERIPNSRDLSGRHDLRIK
jgi:filamentous hemagglutinin